MSWGNNRVRGNPQSVQKLLDENAQLIQAIVDYQSKGKAAECVQYQQVLHKNLMYLASLADSTQNIQAMLPPPPTTNQASNVTPVSSTIGVSASPGNVVGNLQERKGQAGISMDQNSAGVPMTSQVMSSTVSQMASGMHTSPAPMTTASGDGTSNVYGGNVSSQPLDSSSQQGYPGNVNPMMVSNLPPTGQTMMQGQQQNYMPNMHPTRMQQQGQQFMMQQGVGMSYNRPPVQMHPSQPTHHQQQQMNQPYTGNPGLTGQSGMIGYQQATPSYDQYNPMQQHMNIAGYNNPYAPQ